MKGLWIALLLCSSVASAKMLCRAGEPDADLVYSCREVRVILRPQTTFADAAEIDLGLQEMARELRLIGRDIFWARNYYPAEGLYELAMMTNQVVLFHKQLPAIDKFLRERLGFEERLREFIPSFFVSRAGHVWDERSPQSTRIFFLQDVGAMTKLQTHAFLKQMVILKRNLDRQTSNWKEILKDEFPNANLDWVAFDSCRGPWCWARLAHSFSWASEYRLAGPDQVSNLVEEISSEVKQTVKENFEYAP